MVKIGLEMDKKGIKLVKIRTKITEITQNCSKGAKIVWICKKNTSISNIVFKTYHNWVVHFFRGGSF